MRYKGLLLVILVPYAAWQLLSARPVSHDPGVLAPDEPRQVAIDASTAIEKNGARLTPRAEFTARVRVLSRERYRVGQMHDVAPLDIAVGWGPMSDSAVLKDLEISQSNRFYYWHYDDEPPIPPNEIVKHSANWHLVPANNAAWNTLSALRIGDVVTLEGQLVDIEAADVGTIRTSLSRDDSGAGACEIVLVEKAYRERR